MKIIEKVTGRAGTGKTTYLVNKLSELYSDGILPTQTGMVTHMRASARVFTARSLENFPEFNVNSFKNFGTMNSLTAHLVGWKPENAYTSKTRRNFIKQYYPDTLTPMDEYDEDKYRLMQHDRDNISNNSTFRAMEKIYQTLEGLMIYDFDFDEMERATGRNMIFRQKYVKSEEYDKKYGKFVLKWGMRKKLLNPDDVVEFCVNFVEFKENNEILEYSDTIKQCVEDKIVLDVKHLFVDEFQDFNKLQFELFRIWRDNPYVESVCAAGDDAQTVTRFGGANPNYFISTPADIVTKLPRTYRHGVNIFKNAQEYLNKMLVVEECDVLPHPEIPGDVIKTYGNEWERHLNFRDDESVLILAWKKQWINGLKEIVGRALPDMYFSTLGNTDIEKRVLFHYNTIASLERGEKVEWDKIKELFKSSSNCLRTNMIVSETITSLSGTTVERKKRAVLKSVKSEIQANMFDYRDFYTKQTFAEDFMKIKWNGRLLMNNISDIEVFASAQDMFPTMAAEITNKRIGTIHKSKGDEADTVILFMSVPYASVEASRKSNEAKDDIMHIFYVGSSRPRTKLIEVYGCLGEGYSFSPAPFDVV
jgi:superfamily I DNA/RNA helicase